MSSSNLFKRGFLNAIFKQIDFCIIDTYYYYFIPSYKPHVCFNPEQIRAMGHLAHSESGKIKLHNCFFEASDSTDFALGNSSDFH